MPLWQAVTNEFATKNKTNNAKRVNIVTHSHSGFHFRICLLSGGDHPFLAI